MLAEACLRHRALQSDPAAVLYPAGSPGRSRRARTAGPPTRRTAASPRPTAERCRVVEWLRRPGRTANFPGTDPPGGYSSDMPLASGRETGAQ